MADNKLNSPNTVFPNFDEVLQNVAEQGTSIFSIKPMAKYLSGARCVLRVNGKIIGFAFGISWKITTSATEIRTIDDYLPYELAPKHIAVEGNITGFRVPGFGPSAELIQTDMLSFLHQRYIEIEVRDSQTDNLIFLTRRALVTSRTENVRSNQLADLNIQFKAIGWSDERSPEYPTGYEGVERVDENGTNPVEDLKNKVQEGIPTLGPTFDPSNIA